LESIATEEISVLQDEIMLKSHDIFILKPVIYVESIGADGKHFPCKYFLKETIHAHLYFFPASHVAKLASEMTFWQYLLCLLYSCGLIIGEFQLVLITVLCFPLLVTTHSV